MTAYGTRTLPELLFAIRTQENFMRELRQVPAEHRVITLREARRQLFDLKDERDDRFPNWYPTARALGYEK